MLTKGNFTHDEWNHLLCLFNISHFSSKNCLEVMSKRTQEYAGEERVTAKWKPMMNIVSRCSERTPGVLPSAASESPEKTKSGRQVPLSSWNEQHQRTGRLAMGASSSDYSEWNTDGKWSSQVWKSDEALEARTHGHIYCWWRWYGLWRTFRFDHGHSCTGWVIDCERLWTILQKMQCKTSTNVL